MAKKKRTSTKKNSRFGPLFLALGGLALLAIALLVAALARPRGDYNPEFTGGPKLQVDQQQVDFGDVRLGTPVSASFTLTNIGDRPLRFTEQPWIEVKEGC